VNRESIPDPEGASRSPAASAAGPCGWLAWALPLASSVSSIHGQVSWADDVAIVRDLGLWPVGTEGAISTLLAQCAAMLPLGGLSFRLSLVGALALALASRIFYGHVLRALDRAASSPINGLLALLTTSLWWLAPSVRAEALHLGGALPALALLLLGVAFASEAFEQASPRALAATGLTGAALLAESHAAGALFGALLLVLAGLEPRRRWRSSAGRLLGAFAGGLVLLGSLRGSSPFLATLPPVVAASDGHVLELVRSGIAAWPSELGAAPLLACVAGAVVAASSRALRRVLGPWAACVALAALLPALGPGSRALGVLLASLAVSAFFPFALQALLRCLWAYPLPFARPAAVLATTFAATLILARADQAASDPPEPTLGAEAWTDEALTRLPRDSLILIQSPELAYRLMAERTLHGTRPDVVGVPTQLLSTTFLRREPALLGPGLAALSRQLWVNGVPDEYALSRIADERSLFVEPDPSSDRRLLAHASPRGVWLELSPQPVSASERRDGLRRTRAILARAIEGAGGLERLDADTRRILGGVASGHARVLDALGERESAMRAWRASRHIDPIGQGRGPIAGAEPSSIHGRVAVGDLSR
jgi:hypothetical protein